MNVDDIMDSFVNGDFLLAIFKLIFGIVVFIVNILLWPFSMIIKEFIPDLDAALTAFASYFELAGQYMAWVINAFAFPTLALTLIVGYYTFAYGSTFAVWAVKLIIKWKSAIWR